MSRGSLDTFVHNLCEKLSTSSQAGLPDAAPCASLVVKGSRFMKMERVVAALLEAGDAPAQGDPHAA